MIVLKYIANKTQRSFTFVANQVAIIRHESEPRQWHHVRSEHNPADYASRGTKASETKKLEKWRNGAEFLWKNEDEWPNRKIFGAPCSNVVLNGIGCKD